MRQWSEVDEYIAEKLIGHDPALEAALATNAAAGLPAIDVSPAYGKMLHLIALGMGARHVLEIGTLGGYSTIWLARAVGERGRVVTLEVNPRHVEVARANLDRADMGARVEIVTGPALESLAVLPRSPFDLVFIDADKQNGANYVRAALDGLTRPGSVVIVDNVVREGGVLAADSDDPAVIGTRALYDYVAAEPRLHATAVQTVGVKKWDGFLMAVVV